MKTIKIEGLYSAAYSAYRNISFSPEKRAERIVIEYEEQLNEDINVMPEGEKERYIEGYNKHLFAWLYAMSRCASTMITGGSNFPVEQNRKKMDTERKRGEEFMEWRKRAIEACAKKIEAAKSQDQKQLEEIEAVKRDIYRTIDWGCSISLLKNRLETIARCGKVAVIREALEYLKAIQDERGIIFATPRHSIWGMVEIAERFKASLESVQVENIESETNGVKVVRNFQADRIQLFFNGKPEQEVIQALKQSAFKWSPSNGCWQRQLTQNAICATERLLKLKR